MSRSTKSVFFPTLTHFSEVISQRKSNRQVLPSACFRSSTKRPFTLSIAGVSGNCKRFRILPFFALFLAPLANAGNYYVATNGNDTNPGTLSSPWRTIAKAAKTLVAGDTVNIRAGTYQEQVRPRNSGNASGFITYAAYPGETVTIDGSRGLNLKWSGILDLTNRNYLQVSGLRFVNSPGFGIFMSNSSNLRILRNYTYHTSNSGIYMSNSNDLAIDGNEVDKASGGGDQNNGIQEALSIVDSENITVSNNSVHGGGMEGIDAKGSSHVKIFGNTVYDMARVSIYVDSYTNAPLNIEIYNNKIDGAQETDNGNSQSSIMLGAEEGNNVDNVKIYNNIIYNSAGSGIELTNYNNPVDSEPRFSNISVYNNTIYNAGTHNSYYGGGIDVQGSHATNIVIRNNILSKNRYYPIRVSASIPSANVTISNNLIDKSNYAQDSDAKNGTNAVIGNPLFVAATDNDFHLQSTSPAINAGTSTGAPTMDFDLKARPQGGQVDIGALEHGS